MVLMYLRAKISMTMLKKSLSPSGERTIAFAFFGRPHACNICSISPLCMEPNTKKKSTNTSLTSLDDPTNSLNLGCGGSISLKAVFIFLKNTSGKQGIINPCSEKISQQNCFRVFVFTIIYLWAQFSKQRLTISEKKNRYWMIITTVIK